MNKLDLAFYETEKGANRYAAELLRKFEGEHLMDAMAVVHPQRCGYAVQVQTVKGDWVYAARRPKNFGGMWMQ